MTGTDPYVPGHGDSSYDVAHYDVVLKYRPSANRLDGDVTLHCRARQPLLALGIDLHGLQVAKLTADGLARWSQRGSKVMVTLRSTVQQGGEFTVRLRYSGHPGTVPSTELGDAGWEELTDGAIVAAQPHGAPAWFPCNDRPDAKATYTFAVTVPSEYYVAASGRLERTDRSGSTLTWHYQQRAPMACYLAAVQIGRYVARDLPGPTPVRVVAPSDLDGPGYQASFGAQPAMMAYFVDAFGPYPFEDYTTVVTDDDLEIPLESQSLSTFGRNFATDDWQSVRLVAHELAHQWFGNAVTLTRWKDIWLHEGFACYAEWLWSEESGRQSARDWAEHYHQKLASLPADLLLGDPSAELMFDDRVYKRGALTLHALRGVVGDRAFFEILQTWVSQHSGGSVTTADFVAHCGQVADQDLSELFEAWVYELPLPALPG
ncbi:MAG: M1 family metallopeptidase [Propionibacteriales bacterium]|nr:M1 family metallopeptidase [Propionibacteriales bacterium]